MAKSTTKTASKKTPKPVSKKDVEKVNYSGFYQSKIGKLTVLVAGLILTYVFASLAIDSGSLWHYLLTFIALYFALKSVADLVRPKTK